MTTVAQTFGVCVDCGRGTLRNRSPRCWPCYTAQARARSLAHFWSNVDKTDSCWVWRGSVDRRGYGRCNGLTHRYAWQLANGPIPTGMHVLHHCDNPPCVRPSHLFLGTQADNNADRDAKGRLRVPHPLAAGHLNHNSKLTPNQVRDIRFAYAAGARQRELGDRHGVSQHSISKVVRRLAYR